MIEVKETKDITSVDDVEERIYHSFNVYRYLPHELMNNFSCYLGRFTDKTKIKKELLINRDVSLAEEVGDWWRELPLDLDDKFLIAFRCGAPACSEKEWSCVRKWKVVANEFHCHRNTVKNRWDNSMRVIFDYIKQKQKNCAK